MSLDVDDGRLSPLQEIERSVQLRANALALDVDSPDGESRLLDLIHDAVVQWSDDHSRGHRPYELPDPDGVTERAFRNLARYGPLTELLADDDVWEIMVNAPDGTFTEVLLSPQPVRTIQRSFPPRAPPCSTSILQPYPFSAAINTRSLTNR